MSMEIGFAAGFVAYKSAGFDTHHPEGMEPLATASESKLPTPSRTSEPVSTSVMMGFVSSAHLTIEQHIGAESARGDAEGASPPGVSTFGVNLNSLLQPMMFSSVRQQDQPVRQPAGVMQPQDQAERPS